MYSNLTRRIAGRWRLFQQEVERFTGQGTDQLVCPRTRDFCHCADVGEVLVSVSEQYHSYQGVDGSSKFDGLV